MNEYIASPIVEYIAEHISCLECEGGSPDPTPDPGNEWAIEDRLDNVIEDRFGNTVEVREV